MSWYLRIYIHSIGHKYDCFFIEILFYWLEISGKQKQQKYTEFDRFLFKRQLTLTHKMFPTGDER